MRFLLILISCVFSGFQLFSQSSCSYTASVTPVSCYGAGNGKIEILGTSGSGGLGQLYTCSDGTAVTGSAITVGAGEVKRLDGSTVVSSIVIDGGTLITCGSTVVNTSFEIKNGGTLFCIGSFTSNASVSVPAGCRIINLYQAMTFNQQIDVAGLLFNINGSLQCQTQLNVSGKVVNWTDFSATNFTILNGGNVEHHGRWDTKWGAGVIASGGTFKVYDKASTAIQQFTNNGAVIAKSGTASCYKITNSYIASSTGRVYTESGAQLSFCYGGTIPSGSTIESGVALNNSSTSCTNCTNIPPDQVDVNSFFGGTGCSVSWTSTNSSFTPVSGNYLTLNNIGPGVYTAIVSCPGCSNQTLQATVTTPTELTLNITNTATSAQAIAGGGVSPYTYAWSGPSGYTSNSAAISSLAAGNYTLIVTDAKGCTKQQSVTIVGSGTGNCNVSYTKVDPGCGVTNSGSITLTNLPSGSTGNSGYGNYYTCSDGQNLGSVSGDLAVTQGQIVRITTGNIGTLTINGGTVLICGSAVIQNLNLSNGGAFHVVTGSATVYHPFDIPAGSIVSTHEGSLSLYALNSANLFEDVNVYGTLLLVNGALHTTSIRLNVYGKLVNYTEIDLQYLNVKNGGVFDNYGQWIEAPNNPYYTHNIETGGTLNQYGTFGIQVHKLNVAGTITGKSATTACLQVLNTLTGSSGVISNQSGSSLSLCYAPALPSGVTLSGVTQNTGTCACSFITRTLNDNNVAAIFGSGTSGTTCTVSWTSTAPGFVPVSGPYTYLNNLTAGTYTATITCPSCSTQTITITLLDGAGTPIVATVAASGGTATVSVPTGGNGGPYTYRWSPDNLLTSVRTRTYTANGNYTVTVIDSKGCQLTLPFTINSFTTTECVVNVDYQANSQVLVQVVCPNDDCKYQIQTASGSLLPYGTVIKQPCKDSVITSVNCNGNIIKTGIKGTGNCGSGCNPAVAGSCPCNMATDPNCNTGGCQATPCPCDKATDPNCNLGCTSANNDCPCDPLKENCKPCDPAVNPLCSSYLQVTYIPVAPKCGTAGSATLSITNGSGNYSIYTNKTTGPQNLTITGLPVGQTVVTVIDNTTKQQKEIIVTIPATPKSQVSLQPVVNSNGSCNNQFTLAVANAVTGPYTLDVPCCAPYYLNSLTATNGSLTVGPFTVPQDGGNGPFTVKLTDSYCTVYTLQVVKCMNPCNTPESVNFVAQITKTAPSYKEKTDGSLVLTNLPVGVTAYWTGTGINTPVQGNTLSNIGKGDYQLLLLGSGGCTFYTNSNVSLQDGGTYVPRFTLTAGCSYSVAVAKYTEDGALVTGPAPSVQIAWLNPETGGQLATGSSVNIQSIVSGLTLNYLTVKITDAAGNIAYYPFQIPVSCRPVTVCPGTVTYVAHDPICTNGKDGSINILSIPANTTISWVTPALANPGPNAASKTGLAAGAYRVAIISSNPACQTQTLDIYLNNPAPLVITHEELNPGAKITVAKGTFPYTIKWTDNQYIGDTRTDLKPGNQYTVNVTDKNGCAGTYTFIYSPCSINPVSALAVFQQTGNNTSVTIAPSGGNLPYTYLWDDNNLFDPTAQVQNNLATGKDYHVTVTDARACSTQVTIPHGDCNVIADITTTATSRKDLCDGHASIQISKNGAVVTDYSNWTILWDNDNLLERLALGLGVLKSESRIEVTNACGGTHSVYVIDNVTGCGVWQKFEVVFGPGIPPEDCNSGGPVITPIGSTTYIQKCFNDPLEINFSVSGGRLPYRYDWTRNYTGPSGAVEETFESDKAGFTNPGPGSYTVKVRDQNGCFATAQFTVQGPATALSVKPQITAPACAGLNGSATLQITGGYGSYNVNWQRQDDLSAADPAALIPEVGYNATVTDGLGCKATASVQVPQVYFEGQVYSSNDSLCPRTQVTLTARKVTGYNYLWSGPGVAVNTTANRIYVNQVGTYTLTYTPQTTVAGCNPIAETFNLPLKNDCGSIINICDNSVFTTTVTLPEPEDPCSTQKEYIATINGTNQYNLYITQLKQDFRAAYKTAVMGSLNEQITKNYTDHEGHYTLYYYDQAGNLTRTVPPSGVKPLSSTDTETAIAKMKSGTEDKVYTEHTLPTTYQYNSLNQLVTQDMPDHRQQDLWETKAALNLPPDQTVSAVNYLNSTQGLLFANTATETKLYTTNDAGQTWSASTGINLNDILDVQSLNSSASFAVGKQGLFLKGNSAAIWTLYSSPTIADLISVHFTSATSGRIVAADGTMWSTGDGGLTWTVNNALKNTGITGINDIWNQGALMLVSGNINGESAVYYSSNSGAAFTRQQFTAAPYGAIGTDGVSTLIGGNLGALYKLDAFGKLHIDRHTNLTGFIKQLLYKNNTYTALVISSPTATQGDIYTSTDGKAWTAATTSANVKVLYELGSSIAAIKTDGTYGTSANWASFTSLTVTSAESWGGTFTLTPTEARTPSGNILTKPAVTSTEVLAGGKLAYKTSTGTWQQILIKDYWEQITSAVLLAPNDFLIVASDEKLYRTQQAPAVNNVVPDNTLTIRTNTGITASSRLYLVGTTPYLLKTSGMITKLTANSDGSVTAADQYAFPENRGIWGMNDLRLTTTGNGLHVQVSFNDGTLWERDGISGTWSNKNLALVPANILAVAGNTDATLYATGSNGEIYKKANTSDSQWNYQPLYSSDITLNEASVEGTTLRVASGADIKSYASGALTAESSLSGAVNEMDNGLAATQDGKIYTRSGTTWTASFTDPQGRAITDVSTLIAAGTQQLYYLNGATWTLAQPVKVQPIQAVATGSSVVAVGNNSTILISDNGGNTWRSSSLVVAQNQALISVAANGNQLVAGSSTGGVYYSTNNGTSWNVATATGTDAVRKIVMPASNRTWLVKGSTLMYSGSTPPSSFTTLLTATSPLYGLSVDADGYGYAVGDNGTAYRIQPTGSFNTEQLTAGTPVALNSQYAAIKISTDANLADDKGSGLPAQNLRGVSFTDRLVGYLTVSTGMVLKTSDGGYHWKQENNSGTNSGTTPILALGGRENGTLVDASGKVLSLRDRAQQLGSRYWYDELGRMVLGQTAKQYNIERHLGEKQYRGIVVPGTGTIRAYSVTLYDEISRITETYELLTRATVPSYKHENQVKYATFITGFAKSGAKSQITNTYFDEAAFANILNGFDQKNLRSMIASVTYKEREGNDYDRASHYSYDIHKNVNSVVQEIKVYDTRLTKKIDYDYDLISGKVNYVYYQKGQADQFIHKYEYDGDNRMVTVKTSKDGVTWALDAHYQYYAHEGVGRLEYGDAKVEVQDHAYTAQGWAKASMGKHFSYALGYNNKDYVAIGDVSSSPVPLTTPVSKELFNSNIASIATLNKKLSPDVKTELYQYDQLNRLLKSDVSGAASYNFSTTYSYDANTNLSAITRRDKDGILYDNLSFNYENKNKGYQANTNRLRSVSDGVTNSAYAGDIEHQDTDNYRYDEVGNVSFDDQEGTDTLEWYANNKIRFIKRRSTSSKPDLEFVYDANMKHRVAKIVKYKSGVIKTTYYVNDAAGNLLTTYTKEDADQLKIKEQFLYGAQRLGTLIPDIDVTSGNREYELVDNLESVRATVSDFPSGTGLVTNAFDYYPYGMIASAFNSPEGYRYGFNGWERDDEVEKGDGNEYGTDFRQYDARTGRYSGVDPLAISLPAYSPYSHALGNPIRLVDTDGDWPKPSASLEEMGMKLPPLVAGLIDGLADGSPIGMVGMAWDICTDAKFRSDMINAFTEIAKDPIGFLGAMFSEYKDVLERIATGKATPEDIKMIGEEIGSSIAGALTGSAMNKIFGKVKVFQKMKMDAKLAKKVDGKSPVLDCPLCFTALTQIQTNKGLKNIKDIVVGDSVLSFDEFSGKFKYQRVNDTHMRYADTVYVIYAADAHIETTGEHPFFIRGEWIRARKLAAGDKLTLASGDQIAISRIGLRLEKTQVFNFTVENFSTYTVGNSQILVHNCKGKSGFYEVKSNGVETYVGKGGEKRAKISLKNHTGNDVYHFDISKGVAGFSVDQTAFIFEALHMDKAAAKLAGQGQKVLENKIKSPGHKLIAELGKTKAGQQKLQQLTTEYNKLIQQGGKKL